MERSIEREKQELFRNLRRQVHDEKVLSTMEQVPRQLFVPAESRHLSYKDIPLPVAEGQTISQPYIIALMTSALGLRGSEKVLELGTGSGYQAAVLSLLVPKGRVLSLERIRTLAEAAETRLRTLGYDNVEVRMAGHVLGCPEKGPFDAIIVAAAAPKMPSGLLEQLAPQGRMVIPIGNLKEQELAQALRTSEGVTVRMLGPCRFVPLIGQDAWPEEPEEL